MQTLGRRAVGIGVGIGTLAVVLGATARRPKAPCELAAAWVEAHSESLPRTFDSLIEIAPAYRRAVLATLPGSEKKALWAEQLRTFLLPADSLAGQRRAMVASLPSPLTVEQRDFIRSAVVLLDSIYADSVRPGQRLILGVRAELRALTLFDRRTTALLFERLGPQDALPAKATVATASVFAFNGLASRLIGAKAKLNPDCNCSQSGSCWGENEFCVQSYPYCSITQDCGFLGTGWCDGVCKFVE